MVHRIPLTLLASLAWLIASPSLELRDAGWVEVGAPPAAAQIMQDPPQYTPQHTKKKSGKKARKAARPARVGSSGVVTSNQPGKYPMQPITPPQMPDVAGNTVIMPARDPFYPNVPVVTIIPRGATGGAGVETSQDRVVRCTHQSGLGGLSGGQQGAYVSNCAF
jgi:hypothetical protein